MDMDLRDTIQPLRPSKCESVGRQTKGARRGHSQGCHSKAGERSESSLMGRGNIYKFLTPVPRQSRPKATASFTVMIQSRS